VLRPPAQACSGLAAVELPVRVRSARRRSSAVVVAQGISVCAKWLVDMSMTVLSGSRCAVSV